MRCEAAHAPRGGTEPFWAVTVSDTGIVFASPEETGMLLPPAVPVTIGDETVYRSRRTSGEPREIELRLRMRSCDNGMAERVYPMSARLSLDDLALEGCAEQRGVAGDGPGP